MTHKSGFINIIGNPNVGKSTLMNAMVGAKLSIITNKVQTTRHRIMGIVNGDDYQIVYSDTPGIINPNYKLQESMMRFIEAALIDADIFLYVTDVADTVFNEEIVDKIKETKIPLIVAVNKIDLAGQEKTEAKLLFMKNFFPDAHIIPISALHKFNLETVFQKIIDLLPESPPFFPKDELTDRSLRFFASEIIREKILLNFQKEVPYSVEVAVDKFKEKEKITFISAYIYVIRESQKAIILGHEGRAIKKLGTQARIDLEDFLGRKVFLELSVKVNKDWRDNDLQLKRFGYTQ